MAKTRISLATLVRNEGDRAILHVSVKGNYDGVLAVHNGIPYVSYDGRDYRVMPNTKDRITLFDRLGRHRVYDQIID